jgi:hypothetical protein
LGQLLLLADHPQGQDDKDKAGQQDGRQEQQDLFSVASVAHDGEDPLSEMIF